MYVYMCMYQYVHLYIHNVCRGILFVCVPVYLSIHLSTYLSIYPSIYLPTYLSTCLSISSIYPSMCFLCVQMHVLYSGRLLRPYICCRHLPAGYSSGFQNQQHDGPMLLVTWQKYHIPAIGLLLILEMI